MQLLRLADRRVHFGVHFHDLLVQLFARLAGVSCPADSCSGVKYYGEAEFWFSLIKVIAIVGLIILGIVLFFGGGPNVRRDRAPDFIDATARPPRLPLLDRARGLVRAHR